MRSNRVHCVTVNFSNSPILEKPKLFRLERVGSTCTSNFRCSQGLVRIEIGIGFVVKEIEVDAVIFA